MRYLLLKSDEFESYCIGDTLEPSYTYRASTIKGAYEEYTESGFALDYVPADAHILFKCDKVEDIFYKHIEEFLWIKITK